MSSVAGPIETLPPASKVPPSDGFYEVVGTEIVEKPPMGVFESGLAGLLLELLGPFARAHRLGQFVPQRSSIFVPPSTVHGAPTWHLSLL
jgi:hypothetical protein